MYQYESKKPLKSAKSTSSDKGKKVASSRRVFSDSSPFPHNRQMLNTIQRSRFSTGMPAVTENRYGAGSARPPFDELPDFFSETGTNRRQVPENITSSPLIITATAPMADNQYGAEAAGRFNEQTTACSGNLKFINGVLSKDHWQDIINSDEIRVCADKVLSCWKAFLPEFLLNNGFKPYRACQSLTYHRPSSNAATEALDYPDKKGISKIEGVYKSDSAIRYPRKYTDAEEIKRYLRHLAAALEINFGIKNEIQCYYDDNIVYVATNNDVDSENLSCQIDDMRVSEYLQFLQYSYKKIIQREAENDNSAIWDKFQLNDAIFSDKKYRPPLRRLRHALMCPDSLKGATFKVIKDNFEIRGLHAERRILYHLRETRNNNELLFLDPLRLGGIRRPCFVCSALCFAEMSQVHPGPVWVSDAASKPRDVYEMFLILDAIRKAENLTFISFSEGHLTMDNDSDSDEESEGD